MDTEAELTSHLIVERISSARQFGERRQADIVGMDNQIALQQKCCLTLRVADSSRRLAIQRKRRLVVPRKLSFITLGLGYTGLSYSIAVTSSSPERDRTLD